MKAIVFKDKDIKKRAYNALVKDFTKFIEDLTDIKPTIETVEQVYTEYPTYIDDDEDIRPTEQYLKTFDGTEYDHIFILIHEDNWLSDPKGPGGIWGTNYSYSMGDWHTHYCRYDKDNSANAFGTIYHEWMHSLDALVKVETGIDIRKTVGVSNWDSQVVHGKSPDFDYIRWKENFHVLEMIAPNLRAAYGKRQYKRQQKQIIGLLEKLVRAYRILVNRKNGVPR